MIRTAVFAALLSLPLAAQADAPKDQLRSLVGMEMPNYVADVDVDRLSRTQLASIYSIMHSSHSSNYKRSMIRSVLGGPHSLRGVLFK